jgi:uncharacterized protein (TIGR02996 family)
MTQDDAFLQAIMENPDDDTPRLIYADWLEERGDPRGEFIRVQCQLTRMSPGDERRIPLEQLERRLLERHQDAWLGSLRSLLVKWSYRRGFLDTVAVSPSIYLLHDSILSPATVRRLEVELTDFTVPPALIDFVPDSVARENLWLPLGFRGRTLVMAGQDPVDTDLVQKLEFILNRDIEPVAAPRDQIMEAIERGYGQMEVESVDVCCFVDAQRDFEWDVTPDDTVIARLVDLIIVEAMNLNATEIRIDSERECLRVRYRIRGQWVERDTPPRRLLDSIVARIRLMAGMAFTKEKREQVGRVRGTLRGRPLDLDVLVRWTEKGPGLLLSFITP